jgi:hypothetical protein
MNPIASDYKYVFIPQGWKESSQLAARILSKSFACREIEPALRLL